MAQQPKENEPVAEAAEDDAAADSPGAPKRRKRGLAVSGKKLALLALPVLLLIGGGYYGVTQYGIPGIASSPAKATHGKVYYDLPEMVVNLSSGDKRVQYLKLKVALEAADQKVIESLMPVMPRILDMFQLYLRELRSTDLEGSAGLFRLKEELLRRINIEIRPQQVDRVLFKEIIVQ